MTTLDTMYELARQAAKMQAQIDAVRGLADLFPKRDVLRAQIEAVRGAADLLPKADALRAQIEAVRGAADLLPKADVLGAQVEAMRGAADFLPKADVLRTQIEAMRGAADFLPKPDVLRAQIEAIRGAVHFFPKADALSTQIEAMRGAAGFFAKHQDMREQLERALQIERALQGWERARAEPNPASQAAELLETTLEALSSHLSAVESRLERKELLDVVLWLVALLLTIYALWKSELGNEQVVEQVQRVDVHVQSVDDRLVALDRKLDRFVEIANGRLYETSKTFYFALRPVRVTTIQKYSGPLVCRLVPGQEVELVERAKRWLRVKAVDNQTQEVCEGWVLKKYLIREVPLSP